MADRASNGNSDVIERYGSKSNTKWKKHRARERGVRKDLSHLCRLRTITASTSRWWWGHCNAVRANTHKLQVPPQDMIMTSPACEVACTRGRRKRKHISPRRGGQAGLRQARKYHKLVTIFFKLPNEVCVCVCVLVQIRSRKRSTGWRTQRSRLSSLDIPSTPSRLPNLTTVLVVDLRA